MSAPMSQLPPGDGWQSIASAPTTGVPVWVEVWNGKRVVRAHHACDRSGEEQPSFGPAWFYEPIRGSAYFEEVTPAPTHWRAFAPPLASSPRGAQP